MLDDADQHALTSEIFHESGEKFSKAVTDGSGTAKDLMRNIYTVAILLGFTGLAF